MQFPIVYTTVAIVQDGSVTLYRGLDETKAFETASAARKVWRDAISVRVEMESDCMHDYVEVDAEIA